jgi:hypothetical protein
MPKISLEEAQKYLTLLPIKLLSNKAKDLSEYQFGRGYVIQPIGRNKRGCILNLCICQCGNYYISTSTNLLTNKTNSCGCIRNENNIKLAKIYGKQNGHKNGINKEAIIKRSKTIRIPKIGNSLAEKYPESIKLWDYDKNNGLTPYNINFSSATPKRWFQCKYRHSYDCSPSNFYKGSRCPYCSGKKILIGFNDLLTLEPELCEEWDYEKNELGPKNYSRGTNTKVWWKCKKCNYNWMGSISNRTKYIKPRGCMKCNISHGENIIAYFFDINNIKYEIQKTFNNCRGKSKYSILKFDFYLNRLTY